MRGADNDPTAVGKLLHRFSGELAFDIGGNVGDTARVFADRFDRVVSFEPCEESFAILSRLGLPSVEAHPIAVSDHNGDVVLDVQSNPIKSGQLTTGGYAGWGPIVGHRTVECRTLDSLADEHGTPDLVKIDTEAHELLVVQGALDTLTKHTPDLYIEVHDAALGQAIRDLLEPAYGSRLRRIQHSHYSPSHWGYDNHYWLITGEE